MGRIIKLYVPGADRVKQELVYENSRKLIADTAPSRLNCTFICPTEIDSVAFAATDAPKLNQWYFVEPVENRDQVFVTSFNLWVSCSTEAKTADVAKQYWTAPVTQSHREILFPDKLRITSYAEDSREIVKHWVTNPEGREKLKSVGLKVQ
jgi:hypothetical protein